MKNTAATAVLPIFYPYKSLPTGRQASNPYESTIIFICINQYKSLICINRSNLY